MDTSRRLSGLPSVRFRTGAHGRPGRRQIRGPFGDPGYASLYFDRSDPDPVRGTRFGTQGQRCALQQGLQSIVFSKDTECNSWELSYEYEVFLDPDRIYPDHADPGLTYDEVNMVNDQKCAPVGAHFCCERQGTCIYVSKQIKLHEQYVKPFIV